MTFADATIAATTATFSAAGTYVLRLTANDGELSGYDELTVTVNSAETNSAIDFAGTDAYVTFGAARGFECDDDHLEAWFRRRARRTRRTRARTASRMSIRWSRRVETRSDGSNVNMNYFLGLDGAGHARRRLRGHARPAPITRSRVRLVLPATYGTTAQ